MASLDVPVPAALQRAGDLVLRGDAPRTPEDLRFAGPVTFAPIQVRGAVRGVVILAAIESRGVIREVTRFLAPPVFLFLLTATVLAAWIIVGPARRRLAALEAAASRIAEGDLSARASDRWPRRGGARRRRVQPYERGAGGTRGIAADVQSAAPAIAGGRLSRAAHPADGHARVSRDAADGRRPARRRSADRYLETVRGETLRLERIVSDLVDLARFENNVGSLEVRVFAIDRLFDRVLRRHERDASARRIRFTVDVGDGADQVSADPHRLEQVVDNLVSNALRYVADGGTIGLRASADRGVAIVAVSDSGLRDLRPNIWSMSSIGSTRPTRPAPRAEWAAASACRSSRPSSNATAAEIAVASRPGHTVFTITLPNAAVSDGGAVPDVNAAEDGSHGPRGLQPR